MRTPARAHSLLHPLARPTPRIPCAPLTPRPSSAATPRVRVHAVAGVRTRVRTAPRVPHITPPRPRFGYIVDHPDDYPGAAGEGLASMIFSHFCGIWLSATLYFMAYCAATRNKPVVYAETTLPGIISGLIWATAQVSWFFANSFLVRARRAPPAAPPPPPWAGALPPSPTHRRGT